jgi:hypothetical protein
MAKVSSLEKIKKVFEEAMQRASLSIYFSNNRHLICKNEFITIIDISESLWNALQEANWMAKHQVREIDPNNEEERSLLEYDKICDVDGWIDIADPMELYKGKIQKVKIPEIDYSITYTKDLFPIRLKKAEYKSMSTKLTKDKSSHILALRKIFQEEDHSFAMIRLFRIL